MRTHSVNAPRLEIFRCMARPGMLLVYSGLQENQQAQEYVSRSGCSFDQCCPRTIFVRGQENPLRSLLEKGPFHSSHRTFSIRG